MYHLTQVVNWVNGFHLKQFYSEQSSGMLTEASQTLPSPCSLLDDSIPPLPPPLFPQPKPRTNLPQPKPKRRTNLPEPKPRTRLPQPKPKPRTNLPQPKPRTNLPLQNPPDNSLSPKWDERSLSLGGTSTFAASSQVVDGGYFPSFFPDSAVILSPVRRPTLPQKVYVES